MFKEVHAREMALDFTVSRNIFVEVNVESYSDGVG